MEHSRINRGRKSLEQAVNLQKLPVIQVIVITMTMTVTVMMAMTMTMTMTVQEELSVGKKWNTNGDKDDQSGGAPAASTVRGSINSDLGDPMSSRVQGLIIKSLDQLQTSSSIKSLDLGSTDSSWMDAAGTITDSEEEDDISKEVCAIKQDMAENYDVPGEERVEEE